VIEGSLSVDELNDILDDLSKNTGKQYDYVFMLTKPPRPKQTPGIFNREYCNGFITGQHQKSSAGLCELSSKVPYVHDDENARLTNIQT
jgi:hypothetical protein